MDSETAAAAAAPAGIVRRPVGPRSRRPPTHAGVGGVGRMQDPAAVEDAAEAADSALPPLREEANTEKSEDGVEELFDGISDCEPAAEKQDEEPADRSAAVPRRPLPRGAVPLLLLPPGGVGSALKPRLARTPRPMTTMDTVYAPADSPTSAEAATAPAVLESSSSPKLRQHGRPPGVGAAMVSTNDLAAIRLQLRRAASPQPAAASSEESEPPPQPPHQPSLPLHQPPPQPQPQHQLPPQPPHQPPPQPQPPHQLPPQPPHLPLLKQPPARPPPPSLHSLPPLSPPLSPPQPAPRQLLPPQLPPKPPPPQLPPPQLPPKPGKRIIVKADDIKE